MKVLVHVRDKQIEVQCGEGTQPVRWLANVGISRYDSSFGMELGAPRGVRLENGSSVNLNGAVRDLLKDGDQIYVLLRTAGTFSISSHVFLTHQHTHTHTHTHKKHTRTCITRRLTPPRSFHSSLKSFSLTPHYRRRRHVGCVPGGRLLLCASVCPAVACLIPRDYTVFSVSSFILVSDSGCPNACGFTRLHLRIPHFHISPTCFTTYSSSMFDPGLGAAEVATVANATG